MQLVSVTILLLPPLFVSIIILFGRGLFCVLCITFSIKRSSSHHKDLWGYKHNYDSDTYRMKSTMPFLLLHMFPDKQWEKFGRLCFSKRWCKDDCSFKALLSTALGTSLQYILELFKLFAFSVLFASLRCLLCQSSSLWVTFLFMSQCFPSYQKLTIGTGCNAATKLYLELWQRGIRQGTPQRALALVGRIQCIMGWCFTGRTIWVQNNIISFRGLAWARY